MIVLENFKKFYIGSVLDTGLNVELAKYGEYENYENTKLGLRKYAYNAIWHFPDDETLTKLLAFKSVEIPCHPTLIVNSIDDISLSTTFTDPTLQKSKVLIHLTPLVKVLRKIKSHKYDDLPFKVVELARVNIYKTIRKCMEIETRLKFDIFKYELYLL